MNINANTFIQQLIHSIWLIPSAINLKSKLYIIFSKEIFLRKCKENNKCDEMKSRLTSGATRDYIFTIQKQQ